MFGKLFKQTYSGSMRRSGADVFAVWPYILAHANKEHLVEVDAGIIAFEIGMEEANVVKAIEYLSSPDPNSRNPAEGGRRIVPISGIVYRVVSGEAYHSIKSSEDLLEYNRKKQQESRDRKNAAKMLTQSRPLAGEPTDKRLEDAGISQEARDKVQANNLPKINPAGMKPNGEEVFKDQALEQAKKDFRAQIAENKKELLS